MRIVAAILLVAHLAGCATGAPKYTSARPAFSDGLAAINREDFSLASYHFSELAKEGDPAAMNNLGVSLLMVNRKDEALYWFNKASRFGDSNARETLAKMGEHVPPLDMVGKHPTQLQKEATEKFVAAAALGILVGVSAYYSAKSSRSAGAYSDSSLLRQDSMDLDITRRNKDAQGSDASNNQSKTSSSPRSSLVEREIEVTNIYTREKYKGTVDKFGNVEVRKKYDPLADKYKGTLDSDGSASLRDISGNNMKIRVDQ